MININRTLTYILIIGGMIAMTSCSNSKTETGSQSSAAKTVQTASSQTETAPAAEFKKPEEYGKVIALTFDDGPSPVTTNMVLDVLEKYDVRATFFLVGNNISEGTADTIKREYDMGCEIANHSQTHSYMTKMTADEIKAEIDFTDGRIKEITGTVPAFFRPPYIDVNDTMFENIDKPFINGFGCNDWDDSVTAEERAQTVLNQAEDGAIILMHDAQGNDQTVEALETIIPALLDDGYELVTVSELFHAKNITPDEDSFVYSNVLQETPW